MKFVTLNPAIQLGINSRVGSLKKGKDADFAIWTTNPLDYRAVCVQTWIDGKLYFDSKHARKRNQERQKERELLLTLAKEQAGGDKNRRTSESAQKSFFNYHLKLPVIHTLILAVHMIASNKGGT